MKRNLFYRFFDETPDELRMKIAQAVYAHDEHLSKITTFSNYECECEACTFLYYLYSGSGYQRSNHVLPYEKIYSKESLQEDLNDLTQEKHEYEASILSTIFKRWKGNSCFFRYS